MVLGLRGPAHAFHLHWVSMVGWGSLLFSGNLVPWSHPGAKLVSQVLLPCPNPSGCCLTCFDSSLLSRLILIVIWTGFYMVWLAWGLELSRRGPILCAVHHHQPKCTGTGLGKAACGLGELRCFGSCNCLVSFRLSFSKDEFVKDRHLLWDRNDHFLQ